jgi:energy-coupling factor transporter ATP-binding protein EcfA2
MANIDFNEHFKLPIYYNNSKVKLKDNIINDLELVKTVDPSGTPMYNFLFNNDNEFSKKLNEQTTQYYTTDTDFLKDNQTLIKSYKSLPYKYKLISENYNKIIEIWDEIKNDTGFKDKYYYIDWPMWEFLNKSEQFLQFTSIYSLASPIISFFIPIIMLILPFFIIRIKGLSLTIDEYIEVLKTIISNHSIGKLFTEFHTVELNQKIYILVSAGFYVFSIYQNILTCRKFNNNMTKIHNYFNEINLYLEYTINSMNNYLKHSGDLNSHQDFNNNLKKQMTILTEFKEKISAISPYEFTFKKLFEIGHVLKYFYELHTEPHYNDAFLYSFGFNGYIDCLEGLSQGIEERKINIVEYINSKKRNTIKNNYYAALKESNPVKNNIKLHKNLIITGPNASGKTTILKSVLINVILSQQFGCGFYDSAKLKPYKHIHCYLNIPDTSGRDSLFQAEARRCKEIIDIIDSNKTEDHLAAFDELYSGTNPDEAVISAVAFMEYLVKNKNVSCLLTTHFIKVCKKLQKNKNIENFHMEASKNNNKIEYKYLLLEGISFVKGGINVLNDLNYPKEIIDNTIKNQDN